MLRGISFRSLPAAFCRRGFSVATGIPIVDTNENPIKRKIIKQRHNREIVQKRRAANEKHELAAKALGLGFRLVGASVLHRYPVVTRDAPEWESKMWDLQDLIEDRKREHFISLVEGTDAQFISTENPTIEEILESMPFKPASRITEADLSNDRRSLDRHMDKSLYLIVKRNREDNSWQFPQGKWMEGETMRQTGERVGDRAVGKVNRWYISNAPIGHYCYAYSESIQKQRQQYGAKVFFYRNQLFAGNIRLETKLYKDFAWISRDEVSDYFDPETSEFLKFLLPM